MGHRNRNMIIRFYGKYAMGIHEATAEGLVRTLVEEGCPELDLETKKILLGLKIYEHRVVFAGSLDINRKSADPVRRDPPNQIQPCIELFTPTEEEVVSA